MSTRSRVGPPVIDLARRFAALQPELGVALDRVLTSGRLLLGPEVEAFEAELGDTLGRRHAVAVGSGTDALRLAMVAMGIGAGDEVIVPALTAVPTAAAVCATGARPVFVDVDRATALIDWGAVARARTERTRLVVPVHLYGRPVDIPATDLPVLEDAAQAFGALDPRAPSRAAAYSFYPTKNLGGLGDGGAVLTDDPGLAGRLRALRNHGLSPDGTYDHEVIAGNSRLSEIGAAALRVALPRVAADNARRAVIAARYRDAASGVRWQAPHERHVYHLCVGRVADRDEFRTRVSCATAVHYPRALTQQTAYAHLTRNPCPVAEQWAAECVTFPCFPEMNDDEIAAVSGALA
jgi:dTDP-4-amino-4,6-dideoxygalactose transaminase